MTRDHAARQLATILVFAPSEPLEPEWPTRVRGSPGLLVDPCLSPTTNASVPIIMSANEKPSEARTEGERINIAELQQENERLQREVCALRENARLKRELAAVKDGKHWEKEDKMQEESYQQNQRLRETEAQNTSQRTFTIALDYWTSLVIGAIAFWWSAAYASKSK